MGNHMTKRQKMISYTLNFYVTSILMYMITQNVVANIMASYPEVADYTVKSLTTLPTLFGLLATFAMGPIAMKFDKVKLLVIVMCSMGIFSLIFFANGVMHGPFELYYVAVVFGGFAQGSFAPLMNLIIGENFDEADRAGRIASYNVTNNVGAFFVLLISGRIAATNDGANWPYAYLLGLYCFVTTAVFYVLIKKAGYRDDKAARAARAAAAGKDGEKKDSVKLTQVPKKVIGIVAAIGLLHCVFYIGLNAYYTNVSTWISENGFGGAAQAGNATSLVRFTLIIMTFLYPFWTKLLKSWMIPCGYLLGAIAMVCMVSIDSIWGVYAAAFFVAFGTSIAHSTIYSKALNYVPESFAPISSTVVWGLANSGAFFATYVLAAISGVLGGGMRTQLWAGSIILVACMVVAIIIFVVFNPDKKKQAA